MRNHLGVARAGARIRFACRALAVAFLCFMGASYASPSWAKTRAGDQYLFDDSHFHLTNYVQKGTNIKDYIAIMGDKVGRSTLFGIPLQQMWSYQNSGDFAPTYYLQSDAPLYYYSFTDAVIAHAYLSLPAKDRKRLDPMITGFNPADMYAVDHIRRCARDVSGRVFRNRRVHDPQGVRLAQGRRRRRQPSPIPRWIGYSTSRARSAWS